MNLTLAHSPDSDDAFMFWAMAKGHVATDDIRFEHILSDIQSLNQAALEGKYDITAISLHTYPYIAQNYAILGCGASVGDGYGPVVISKDPMNLSDLPGTIVAIPGSLTTAALTLRLAIPGVRTEEMGFDQIMGAVRDGNVAAGVIIHEGQVTYEEEGFHKVVDLGEWWGNETGLSLPLGANVIKRQMGEELMARVAGIIQESIAYGLAHRGNAINYAQDFAGKLVRDKVDTFVSMYVNDFTLDWGERGRQAVEELMHRGAEAGIIPVVDTIDFIE